MLPKQHRLPGPEIPDVQQKGRHFTFPDFNLKVFYRRDNYPNRFAFVVSSKIEKKAVRRNRLKRRLREAVRRLLPSLKLGHDIIIFAKKELAGKEYQQILSALQAAFTQARLLKGV